MDIKFLRHGTGDAKKASAYVLAERDHLGRIRAGVEVLRGDPDQVAIDKDRYCWTAVRHDEENGAVHVHVLIARVELETGKASCTLR